ncbi:phage baseplate assembly protein V [Bosea sp. MMO-172]|uniref:phage baseplate assembly protein V n=1 Tax=Bosea sp. MMO-172 TaxID=3127885 RepID=UPI00301A5D6B
MSDIPDDLPGQIRWIADQLADQKRRDRNRKRTGTIVEVDNAKGLARVEFSDRDGRKFIGPPMPWGEIAAGETKTHIAPSLNQQVTVISESGDLADGEISMSVPSNANPRPHDGPEMVITRGQVRLFISGDTLTIDAPTIALSGQSISCRAQSISYEASSGELA